MESKFEIVRGLPEELRCDAAALYFEAFGQKLGPILGRDDRAKGFLSAVLRPSHAIAALDTNGDLMGLAGFHDTTGGFVGGGLQDLRAHYGVLSSVWRGLALSLFEREPTPGEFLMDGIAVVSAARGHGIGGALLSAIIDAARNDGAAQVRLDVIDANPRARALYERTGFKAVSTQRHGLLTRPFGFAASTTMTLALE